RERAAARATANDDDVELAVSCHCNTPDSEWPLSAAAHGGLACEGRRVGRRRRRAIALSTRCKTRVGGTQEIAEWLHGAMSAADHVGDEARPTRVMRRAESGRVVAMEVFVEEQIVLPIRIALHALNTAEAWSPPVRTNQEYGDQTVPQVVN